MASPLYTHVVVQSVKPLPGAGLQIVLVASGAGLPDVVDTYRSNGLPFQPLTLRAAAIALVNRLNANDALEEAIVALVGHPIDLTPIPPDSPNPDEVAALAFGVLVSRLRQVTASHRLNCASQTDVEDAQHAVRAAYAAATPVQRLLFDVQATRAF